MRRKALKHPATARAIAGIRVSTPDQTVRQGPDRQRREILETARDAKLEIERWIEESVSGADHDRAAENLYYEAVRATPGLNVLFSSADRVGRYVEVTVGIARQIRDLGGVVWIAGIGNLEEGRNWDYFLSDALDGETEYSKIVKRMQGGKLDKARRGLWPHGRPAWGYIPERDHRGFSTTLKFDEPSAQPTVKLMFEAALEDGCAVIQDILHARELPSPGGTPRWTTASIYRLLTNTTYAGEVHYKGEIVPVPAMVSRGLFDAVQDAIRSRQGGRPPQTPALLSGHLECALCHASLTFTAGNTPQKRYYYYTCRMRQQSRATRENKERCSLPSFKPEALEQQVWEYLLEHLTDPTHLSSILGQDEKTPDYSSEKAALLETVKRAGLAYARGLLTELEADGEAAPARARLRELEALERAGPVRVDAVEAAERIRVELEGRDTLEEKRAFLKRFGVRVRVGPGGIVGVRVRV